MWRFPLLAILLLSFSCGADSKESRDGAQKIAASEKPEVTAELVEVVQAFIAAGEKNDPAARAKYLGPKVFYYGRARTREQAVKAIGSLYRRWPQRKFVVTDSIDLFEIPKHPGVYRVTAIYEYTFENMEEHLAGKSKLTCVVEHDRAGTRIIGVDEKLISGSTAYQSQ
jgi:hypothetical protein